MELTLYNGTFRRSWTELPELVHASDYTVLDLCMYEIDATEAL